MAFVDTVLYYSLGRNIYKMAPGCVPLKWATTADIVTAMYCDERKRLWIGTLGQGLLCASGGNIPVPVSCNSQLTSKQILSISAVKDTIWVASLGGVDEIVATGTSPECTHKQRHSKTSGMGSDYVYQLYADRGNAMWIATDGAGGYRYQNGQYFNVTSGLGLREKVIYSITQGSDDAIWMATMKDGLLRYKNGEWRTYNKTSGLTDHNIYGLKTIRDGNILVLHKKGIDEYYPASGCFRHYTRMLDMDIDSVSETLNCFAVDSRGVVYVPFEHGFISFSRSDLVPDLRSGVHISDILVFSKSIANGKKIFEHSENSFTFKFDGVNFTNPDRLYFRYRLAGYNDDWVVTRDRAAVFPQLPPGRYSFVVQSSLTSDFSVPSQSTFEFLIAKPFWRRSWFLIMAGVIVTTVVLMVIRNRENKLRTRSKLERERHQYEYEYLKSQVNPHFLFNSLNTLVSLIDDNKNAATEYTIHLSDFYRNLLTYNNVDSITMAEELDLLEKYVHIQKTRFGAALNVELQIAPVYRSAGKVVPMALQLLVENAIKHNVVSMASPLHIVISAADGVLTVKNNIKPKVEKEKGAGLGLRNLRERYHLQGGKNVATYIENGYFIVKLPL
ncbi:MAG: histidine kinase [Flavipsychrobacter sp.]|nr:histidine kinase [Flavipsychrobacter sp.]